MQTTKWVTVCWERKKNLWQRTSQNGAVIHMKNNRLKQVLQLSNSPKSWLEECLQSWFIFSLISISTIPFAYQWINDRFGEVIYLCSISFSDSPHINHLPHWQNTNFPSNYLLIKIRTTNQWPHYACIVVLHQSKSTSNVFQVPIKLVFFQIY